MPSLRLSTTISALGFTAALLTVAPAAWAHAIVDLNGVPAYAGKHAEMILEIQHGCGNGEGVDEVAAYFSKSYRKAVPLDVDGWWATTRQTPDGRQVIWRRRGNAIDFNTPTFFPLKMIWPSKPGVYDLPVKQKCGDATIMWDVEFGPATADEPSPPLYPLAQIRVLTPPGVSEPAPEQRGDLFDDCFNDRPC